LRISGHVDDVLDRAESALYEAKHSGRNFRFVRAQPAGIFANFNVIRSDIGMARLRGILSAKFSPGAVYRDDQSVPVDDADLRCERIECRSG
jgi:hypothetical protein